MRDGLRRVMFGFLAAIALSLAAAPLSAQRVVCEGGQIRYRCTVCRYTVCCIFYPDGSDDCWHTINECWNYCN